MTSPMVAVFLVSMSMGWSTSSNFNTRGMHEQTAKLLTDYILAAVGLRIYGGTAVGYSLQAAREKTLRSRDSMPLSLLKAQISFQ